MKTCRVSPTNIHDILKEKIQAQTTKNKETSIVRNKEKLKESNIRS